MLPQAPIPQRRAQPKPVKDFHSDEDNDEEEEEDKHITKPEVKRKEKKTKKGSRLFLASSFIVYMV